MTLSRLYRVGPRDPQAVPRRPGIRFLPFVFLKLFCFGRKPAGIFGDCGEIILPGTTAMETKMPSMCILHFHVCLQQIAKE